MWRYSIRCNPVIILSANMKIMCEKVKQFVEMTIYFYVALNWKLKIHFSNSTAWFFLPPSIESLPNDPPAPLPPPHSRSPPSLSGASRIGSPAGSRTWTCSSGGRRRLWTPPSAGFTPTCTTCPAACSTSS